jgi:hypothetical protein
MPRTKTIPRLNVGDKVRVSSGVSDPDYDDLTIGGWAGTIAEVQNGTPPTLLVRWSKQTLKKQSPIYRKRCERDGFDFRDEMNERSQRILRRQYQQARVDRQIVVLSATRHSQ